MVCINVSLKQERTYVLDKGNAIASCRAGFVDEEVAGDFWLFPVLLIKEVALTPASLVVNKARIYAHFEALVNQVHLFNHSDSVPIVLAVTFGLQHLVELMGRLHVREKVVSEVNNAHVIGFACLL